MRMKLKKVGYVIVSAIMSITLLNYPANVNANYEGVASEKDNNEEEIIGYVGESEQSRITSSDAINHIMNRTFYIKNAFSGQYLDVSNGTAESFTNVQQYPYNGSAAQRWYISRNEEEKCFIFYSDVGNNMVLDIDNASPDDGANAHIHEYNGTDAQKFRIGYTNSSTYVLITKVSNYNKSISTCNSGCDIGENVHQYDYAGLWSERWILEPVEKDVDLGALYAMNNYDKTVQAYPRFTMDFGGDCTNFVSQCMLASGIHFREDWQILRKNGNYTEINNVEQLNNSWYLADPSPWISAAEFRKFWVSRTSNGAYKATGQAILDNPNMVWNSPVTQGCVVQIAKKGMISNEVKDAHHSMYISGYINDGTYNTYGLTYHSKDTQFISLLDVCKNYRDEYFLFYTF